MSYNEIMLDVYEKQIDSLQKKLSTVDDEINKLKQEIADKEIIITAYEKFN